MPEVTISLDALLKVALIVVAIVALIYLIHKVNNYVRSLKVTFKKGEENYENNGKPSAHLFFLKEAYGIAYQQEQIQHSHEIRQQKKQVIVIHKVLVIVKDKPCAEKVDELCQNDYCLGNKYDVLFLYRRHQKQQHIGYHREKYMLYCRPQIH